MHYWTITGEYCYARSSDCISLGGSLAGRPDGAAGEPGRDHRAAGARLRPRSAVVGRVRVRRDGDRDGPATGGAVSALLPGRLATGRAAAARRACRGPGAAPLCPGAGRGSAARGDGGAVRGRADARLGIGVRRRRARGDQSVLRLLRRLLRVLPAPAPTTVNG